MTIATQIDEIDHKLVELFAKRMDVAAGIAAYKKEHGLPVLDPVREREKLQKTVQSAPEALRDYTASLYSLLFELSRCYQNRLLGGDTGADARNSNRYGRNAQAVPHAGVRCLSGRGRRLFSACVR